MAEWDSSCFNSSITGADKVATIRCLEPLFENMVRALVAFVGIGLFVMLLLGGFNFLFAGGDAKKLEKARGTLTAAAIGLIIIVVAYLIIKAIATFTGVTNLTNFKINVN
jgi:hypothetical protein